MTWGRGLGGGEVKEELLPGLQMSDAVWACEGGGEGAPPGLHSQELVKPVG